MAVSLETVVSQLVETGIVASEALADFLPPKAQLETADELLRELSRQQLLTRFQAAQVAHGKAKALILGSYTLLDKIGAGGMGQVYKAEHRRMKRVVAIKTLQSATMKNASAIARFQREVEAAAKLTHPNIVTAHDADEANGLHFLVMEYVEGTDLSALVKQNGVVPVNAAVNYILQASRGLEFAHYKGVVHRDIKPSNLLLSADGTIKILDMGLARIDGDDHSPPADDLTGTGAVMGTFDYMAPEQWADTHRADARTDLYALGCSLFYLLTGRAPYSDEQHRNPVSKMKGHVNEPIPDLKVVRPEVPDNISAVYQKLMAKKANERYQTATAVIEALTPIVARNSINEHPGADRRPSALSVGGAKPTNPTPVTAIDHTPAPTGISAGSLEALIDTARNLFDAHDYQGAMGVLEGVPPASRTEPMDTLLERATQRQSQCERLLSEIEVAKQTHRPKELLTKCEQLLKLKPGHAPTRRILKTLNSYGSRLDAAKFDAGNEPLKLQEASGILKGLGAYYAAAVATAVVAFGVGTALIYPYLGPSKPKPPEDPQNGTATNSARSNGASSAPASGEGWQGWPLDAPKPAVAPFGTEQAQKYQQQWAEYLKLPVERTNSIGMRFRLIPPGTFTLGSTDAEIDQSMKRINELLKDKHWSDYIKSEAPQHTVLLSQPIYLAIHEVTQKQYETIMGKNPSFFAKTGKDAEFVRKVAGIDTSNHPVEGVSWHDAADFCAKLSQKEGLTPNYPSTGDSSTSSEPTGYRLPTEAEWEFACRAGTTTKFWIGDQDEDLAQAGWFKSNSGEHTHAVGELKANPLGLFDTHGNVYEWVEDLWGPAYFEQFSTQPAVNPHGTYSANSLRLIRGGHMGVVESATRSSSRRAYGSEGRFLNIGFRVAMAIPSTHRPAADAQQWINQVGALPADEQVEVVTRKLRELNPAFEGPVIHKTQKGVVRELKFSTNDVSDISPVRALRELTSLECTGVHPAIGILSDLSPLEGMKLTRLYCGSNKLSDFSPLKGMPLINLNFPWTRVSNLKPLKGMPLQYLGFWNTPVKDLSPLKGMPLIDMYCAATPITDLSPLEGIKLKTLELPYSDLSDVSPLTHMTSLRHLGIYNSKVKAADIASLQRALPNCQIPTNDPKIKK